MKIKDLPKEIQDVVKLRCEEQNREFDLEKFLITIFDWGDTIEGYYIWHDVHMGNFQPFYDFHKKEKEVKVKDFKIGDKVICIDDKKGSSLTLNKVYSILNINTNGFSIKNDDGYIAIYSKNAFQKVPNHIPKGIILHSPLDAGSYVGSVSSDEITRDGLMEYIQNQENISNPEKAYPKGMIEGIIVYKSLSEILAPKPKQKKVKPNFELKSINQLNK